MLQMFVKLKSWSDPVSTEPGRSSHLQLKQRPEHRRCGSFLVEALSDLGLDSTWNAASLLSEDFQLFSP